MHAKWCKKYHLPDCSLFTLTVKNIQTNEDLGLHHTKANQSSFQKLKQLFKNKPTASTKCLEHLSAKT
jgi:hypothetical protein